MPATVSGAGPCVNRDRRSSRSAGGRMLECAALLERSHSGLVQRFAKPPSGVTCSEGSNPSLSARILRPMARRSVASAGEALRRVGAAQRAPVAQWIERQVADLKAVSSSLAGRASPPKLSGRPLTHAPNPCVRRVQRPDGPARPAARHAAHPPVSPGALVRTMAAATTNVDDANPARPRTAT